jgi:2-aminoethylphosphonate transport system substrate-binding protein
VSAVVLAGVVGLTGCQSSGKAAAPPPTTAAPAPDKLASAECAGTDRSQQVVVYSVPGLEYWYNDVLTTFQNDCLVPVVYVGLPPDQLAARLQAEQAAPLADVVVAPAREIAGADIGGRLSTTPVPADGIASDRCSPTRSWCAIGETYASWVVNGGAVAAPPTTFDDLLTPPLRGQVQYSGPAQSDAGLAFWLLLDHVLGGTATNFLARLEPSVSLHEASTDAMSRTVSQGAAAVANGDLQEQMNDLLQYPGLSIWFPSVAGRPPETVAIPIGAAAVRGAPHVGNAAAVLRALWTPTAQAGIGAAALAPALDGVTPVDARSKEMSRLLKGVTIDRVDWTHAVQDLDAVDQAWEQQRTAPLSSTVVALPQVPVGSGAPSP